jgi:hypothetical protein
MEKTKKGEHNMACHGKIARLPGPVRAQLNARLQREDDGKDILAWLNSLPEVKSVSDDQFQGRPVTPQNLSDWRRGRFQEWLARQDILAQAEEVAATQKELEAVSPAGSLADHLALVVAFRYAAILAGQGAALDEKALRELRALRPICQVAVKLRRSDHNAARLRIESQRWEVARQKELAAQEVARRFNERAQAALANRPTFRKPQLEVLKSGLDATLAGLDELEKLVGCKTFAAAGLKPSRPDLAPKPPCPAQKPRPPRQTEPSPPPPAANPAAASPPQPNPDPGPQAGLEEKPSAVPYPKLAAALSSKFSGEAKSKEGESKEAHLDTAPMPVSDSLAPPSGERASLPSVGSAKEGERGAFLRPGPVPRSAQSKEEIGSNRV